MSNIKPISAMFVDFKHKPKQNVAHIVLEIPGEHANDVLSKLGGFPPASESRFVGVVTLNDQMDDFIQHD